MMARKKQTKPDSDCVGNLARRVLSYRSMVTEITQHPPPTLEQGTMRECVAFAWVNHARAMIDKDKSAYLEAFAKISTLIETREPVTIDPRAAEYFWDVFPYQDFEDMSSREASLKKKLPPTTKDGFKISGGRVMSDHSIPMNMEMSAFEACRIAKELVELRRFFDPPNEWREAAILEKGERYALRVVKRRYFWEELQSACRHGKDLKPQAGKKPRDRMILADSSMLDTAMHEYPDINALPMDERFKYDFALFCRRFALAGICICADGNWKAVPQPFRIHMLEGNTLTIRIPSYLEMDWKRQFPYDVADMLERRGVAYTNVFPERLAIARGPKYPISDSNKLRDTYYELLAQNVQQTGSLDVENVHLELARLFLNSLSEAGTSEERENRLRLIRRKLREIGVPAPGNDPRVKRILKSAKKRPM